VKSTLAEFVLQGMSDAAELAQRARVLAAITQLSPRRRNELAEAVNMVCRAIAAHGGRGKVRFSLVERQGQRAIEVSVSGLPDDAQQRETPSSSRSGDARKRAREGAVLQRVGELVDHFESSGWPVAGAVIRMAQTLPPAFALPSEAEVAEWAEMLQSNTALDALAYALQRARSLERDLGVAQSQQHLRTELGSKLTEADHLAMLSLVISKTKNAISILQPDGRIVAVNDAFVQMTGYGASEAVGRMLADLLFGPSSDRSAVAAYRHAITHGEELTQDILRYRKNGQTYWVESDLIPVRGLGDQLAQWIVIDTDITRRRDTEEALRAAKETAEKSSRLKSEFLANMSHEIRTPLNAIIGMTDLALATELTQQQQEYLQTVRGSSEALLTLLNDVLDLSKIEAGKMDVEEIDFDLPELIHETVRTFLVRAREKGLQLTVQLADELPRSVRGDPTKLRQVLTNLIGNAIKFTREGEVTVSGQPQWQDEDEISLHFSVRDTGIGIPAEKMDEIFQAFRQADASTTRNYGGSGLGLTISSELVRMMRGQLWADSTPDVGTTFHFTVKLRPGAPLALPPAHPSLTTEQTPPAGSRSPPSPADWKSAPRVRPLHVLIADDHLANRQLVTTVLRSRGHHCSEASDGREAIEYWREGDFDVVLMDVQMPILDGFQATTVIRRREEGTRSHVPIIALTAHAMAGDREKCLAAGMDAYLAKPIRPRQLVALIESVADLKPPQPPNRGETEPGENEPLDQPHPGFDLQYALESLDNDQELLIEQMEFFVKDVPVLLANISQAIADRDAYQLQVAAHRLKGMLARYAYQDAIDVARALEDQGRAGDLDGAAERLDRLRHLVRPLDAAIRRYVNQP